tara:strand:- start:2674 stop:4872 length:2199 start_codon:yes stop_codon:yes gene_type:complete
MIKLLVKIFSILLVTAILIIIYFSLVGLKTEKFNEVITKQLLKNNSNIDVKLKDVNFMLSPLDLSINVKTYAPEIFIDKNKLSLEYIASNIPLKSFFKENFIIDDIKLSTKFLKIRDVITLSRIYRNSTELLILNKIIKEGSIIADINFNFDENGKIKNDYVIKGIVKDTQLKLLNNNEIEKLNFIFEVKYNQFNLRDIRTKFNQVPILSSITEIQKKDKNFYINSKLETNKKDFNFNEFNKIFKGELKNQGIENMIFSSSNDVSFFINEKFKIKDFRLKSNIDLKSLTYINELKNFKKYFKDYKNTLKLKNNKILLSYNKNKLSINGNGLIGYEDIYDNIDYQIKQQDNQHIFSTNIDLKKNLLLIPLLNFEKKKNSTLSINLDGVYKDNQEILFNKISLKENNNLILVKNLNLNKKLEISKIDLIDINLVNKEKIKNQLKLQRQKKNYKISGKNFYIKDIIDQINNNDNLSKSIFDNLNTIIDINISKIYLDPKNFVNNFSGNIIYKKNKIYKSDLVSTFPNNKKLNLTINTNENNEKITTIYSENPKPLLSSYKFIKGFEEGILDFYSVKRNNVSESVLKISDFKIQEVPVLAKLLTLASLQGIADLLTGEGIRFDDFELKFTSKDKLMRIDELYAIGPAISIMMEGYIEKDNLISLKGTLVPATTINRTIASIPLLGNILVGKKVGEGVFGVSFKIKGPKDKLKTTVNPIKTLTPRFITRTLEKLKNN